MDKETRELIEENNKMLRSMQSHQRWSSFFRVIYWIFIIGSFVGTYYYFKPVIDAFGSSFGEIQKSIDGLKKATGALKIPPELEEALNKIRGN